MDMKQGTGLQHIEIRDLEGVPTVVHVTSPAPNETDINQVDSLISGQVYPTKLFSPGNCDQHETIDGQISEYGLENRTVLVVDDDEDALKEMVEALLDHDLHVLPAKDANGALEQATRHKPAYVVMDFNLPKINGLDVVTSMRKFLPHTTYIMISGCLDFCRVATTSNTRAFAILQKPVSMNGIARLIKASLDTTKSKSVNITSMVSE